MGGGEGGRERFLSSPCPSASLACLPNLSFSPLPPCPFCPLPLCPFCPLPLCPFFPLPLCPFCPLLSARSVLCLSAPLACLPTLSPKRKGRPSRHSAARRLSPQKEADKGLSAAHSSHDSDERRMVTRMRGAW
jgi:hypothetical protein